MFAYNYFHMLYKKSTIVENDGQAKCVNIHVYAIIANDVLAKVAK